MLLIKSTNLLLVLIHKNRVHHPTQACILTHLTSHSSEQIVKDGEIWAVMRNRHMPTTVIRHHGRLNTTTAKLTPSISRFTSVFAQKIGKIDTKKRGGYDTTMCLFFRQIRHEKRQFQVYIWLLTHDDYRAPNVVQVDRTILNNRQKKRTKAGIFA